MKKLLHVIILFTISIISFVLGLILIVIGGLKLQNNINSKNKAQITEFIAFGGINPSQKIWTPNDHIMTHFDNIFSLMDHGFGDLWKSSFYSVLYDSIDKTQVNGVSEAVNSNLQTYKVGSLLLEIIGPVLFLLFLTDATVMIYIYKSNIFYYQSRKYVESTLLEANLKSDMEQFMRSSQKRVDLIKETNIKQKAKLEKQLQRFNIQLKTLENKKKTPVVKQTTTPSSASVDHDQTVSDHARVNANQTLKNPAVLSKKIKVAIKKTPHINVDISQPKIPRVKSKLAKKMIAKILNPNRFLSKKIDQYSVGDYIEYEKETFKIVSIEDSVYEKKAVKKIVGKNNKTAVLTTIYFDKN